jgi:HAD superfamily hydrolase (TIGR01549 family)
MPDAVLEDDAPVIRFGAVAFDAFGTLIDYPLRLNPYRRIFGEGASTLTAPEAAIRRREIMTSNRTPAELARSWGCEAETLAMLDELQREKAAMRLYPDVEQTMALLRRRGLRIGVCSNLAQGYGDVVRNLLPRTDAMVLSFEVGRAKPERAIFDSLSSALGVDAAAILFVGDSPESDVRGAQAAGMAARLLRRDVGESLRDVLFELLD